MCIYIYIYIYIHMYNRPWLISCLCVSLCCAIEFMLLLGCICLAYCYVCYVCVLIVFIGRPWWIMV